MTLSVYFQNVRGLRGKCHTVRPNISSCDYDVIGLVETWLQEGVNTSEVFPNDNFTVYRRDRCLQTTAKRDGGGVVLALKKHLNTVRLPAFEPNDVEVIWAFIDLEIPLYICCAYLPDRSQSAAYHSFNKSLQDNITSIRVREFNLLVLGDFNLPSIHWESAPDGSLSPTDYLSNDVNGLNASFVQIMNCFNLLQFNNNVNHNGRILDLVLSDINSEQITCLSPTIILSEPIDRHHPPVQVDIDTARPKIHPQCERKRFDFPAANFDQINNDLSAVNWSRELRGDTNCMLSIFYAILMSSIHRNVPIKSLRRLKYPVWFSGSLIGLLEEKKKLHRHYKRVRNQESYRNFSKIRAKVKMKIVACYHTFVGIVEERMHSHMREFWRYTKSLRKTNTFPSFMRYNTNTATSDTAIAELFRNFFSSVFVDSSNMTTHQTYKTKANQSLHLLQFSEETILEVIQKLNPDKGAGEDGITNLLILKCSNTLVTPLRIIFNKSLRDGIFPDRFKKTIMHPIHKSGDMHDVDNYRPIALLNAFAKIFEKLVHAAVLHQVGPYLDENQHGFLPKRNTCSNLIEFVSFIAEKFDCKEQVDVIFLDLSKAFDRISHHILVERLRSFGITGSLLHWMTSYLEKREVNVVFNGACSTSFFPDSGVPQGSILGPLLFVIYIDDLLTLLTLLRLFYADDGKLCKVINSLLDCSILQHDLHRIYQWCVDNCLPVNPAKCHKVTFTNKTSNAIAYDYVFPDGSGLANSDTTKDLGVTFDGALRFNAHIHQLVLKGFKTLGFIIRTSRSFTSLDAVMHLYRTLLLTQLDYCSPVWSPFYQTHIDLVERVQRRFTRYVYRKFGFNYESYESRCKALGLLTLRKRRMVADQMLLYSVVNDQLRVRASLANLSIRTDRSRRSRDLFYERTWRLNTTFSAPFPRAARAHNLHFQAFDIFHGSKKEFKKFVTDTLWDMDV